MTAAATFSAEMAVFAELLGLELDEQRLSILSEICSVDKNDKWQHAEYRHVPHERDGGKDILEARALYGLLLFGERTILWVAQREDDARDSFRRMAKAVETVGPLRFDVAKIRYSHGEQRIELTNGHRLLVTSPRGARGVSADALLIDGNLKSDDEYSVRPVLAGAPNPQCVRREGLVKADPAART